MISVLYVTKGPYGTLGTAASYMFPKTMFDKGYDIRVLSFGDKSIFDDKVPYLYEVPSFNKIDKAKAICEIANKYRPDIIHMFLNMSDVGKLPFLCLPCLKYKPKWLVDVRSPPLRSKPVYYPLRPLKLIQDYLKQLGFSVIATHVRQSAVDSFHIISKPLYELPFGVNTDAVAKRNWISKDSGVQPIRHFIYVGSIAHLRKLKVLLEGISYANLKLNEEFSFKVDFYGNGDALDDLREYATSLRVDAIVDFKGYVKQDRLFKIIKDYDAGIGYVPYEQYMDSPTLKVLEYMAANIGVIASDTNGVKLHVTNGENGMLFSNDAESIGNMIIEVVTNGYPDVFIENGRKFAALLDWNTIVDKYLLKLYGDMLCDV